jgi:hypothetical protein
MEPDETLHHLRDLADRVAECRSDAREATHRVARCGVGALFTGEAIEAKVAAAHVVAARMGRDLYRVDLAAVVDKYIGQEGISSKNEIECGVAGKTDMKRLGLYCLEEEGFVRRVEQARG